MDNDILLVVDVDVEPQSKARPRFAILPNGGVRTYTPTKTREYEQLIGLHMKAAFRGKPLEAESALGVKAVFHRSNRQRIDCDNLLKAVIDAGTGVVWKDDSQILEVSGRIFLGSEHGHVALEIYRLPDSLWGGKCESCGKTFKNYHSRPSKFCSRKCRSAAAHLSVACAGCRISFTMPLSQARRNRLFCSQSCAARWRESQKRPAGKYINLCQDCHGPVTKRQYKRCRTCIEKSKPIPFSNYWTLRKLG